MDSQNNYLILKPYLPENSLTEVREMIEKYQVNIRLAKNRKRIHGTYYRPTKHDGHRISINQNLNPYAFLITFLHEFAHLYSWVYDHSFQHGKIWQKHFSSLLLRFITLKAFPIDIETALLLHIENVKSSDFLDVNLSRILQKYDNIDLKENEAMLADIPVSAFFSYNNKTYINQGLMRKYYLCKDIATNKKYRFHPLALVQCITKDEKQNKQIYEK